MPFRRCQATAFVMPCWRPMTSGTAGHSRIREDGGSAGRPGRARSGRHAEFHQSADASCGADASFAAAADRVVELNRAGLKVFPSVRRPARPRILDGGSAGATSRTRSAKFRAAGQGRPARRDHAHRLRGIRAGEHMRRPIICGPIWWRPNWRCWWLWVAACAATRNPTGAESQDKCGSAESCPAETDAVDRGYAAQRIVNLMGPGTAS